MSQQWGWGRMQIRINDLCFLPAGDKWVCGVVIGQSDVEATISYGDMTTTVPLSLEPDAPLSNTAHFFVMQSNALKPCGQLIDKSFDSREQAISCINKIFGV